jgi:clan AA aspartic protease
MITGVVNARLEPTIQVPVHDAGGQPHDVEVIIDTAYNGWMRLPPSQVTALGLPLKVQRRVLLADGSTQILNSHNATVIWDGQPRVIEVDAIDTLPLVGTALLQGHELRVKFVIGGTVTIEALP